MRLPAIACAIAVIACTALSHAPRPSLGCQAWPGLDVRFEQIQAPSSVATFPAWWSAMNSFKASALKNISYNGSSYHLPELEWAQLSNTLQPLLMVHDRFFYNESTGEYTVDAYMNDVTTRYGGIQSVLLWHSYPNIGVDTRNQYQMLESLPGYPSAVRSMVQAFGSWGVRVLIPYNPWDTGTDPIPLTDEEAMADHMVKIGASGFNGDTMSGIPQSFFDAPLHLTGKRLLNQPEVGLDGDCTDLDHNLATWGYWDWSAAPPVSKYKWLEPRHMLQICSRWNKQHDWDMAYAWFNGIGFETWESVWGIWLQITDRDGEAARRFNQLSQFFAAVLRQSDSGWTPHVPITQLTGVFASQFGGIQLDYTSVSDARVGGVWPEGSSPHDAASSPVLYTIVNVAESDASGQFVVPYPADGSFLFFDAYHGKQLQPAPAPAPRGSPVASYASVNITIEGGRGFGALYIIAGPTIPTELHYFLIEMAALTKLPLSSWSDTPAVEAQRMTNIETATQTSTPPGMLAVPGSPYLYNFQVSGIEIEGSSDLAGVDVQYDLYGETQPSKNHSLGIAVRPFFIDQFPVTNLDYSVFLERWGLPLQLSCFNYLKDWSWTWTTPCASPDSCPCSAAAGVPTPPAGREKSPVTWVSLNDARTYCREQGYRLPDEVHWQFAAQGGSAAFAYPWGAEDDASRTPQPTSSQPPDPPMPVDAFLNGTSDFGFSDAVGNVWEWTGVTHVDRHTRRAILKGGSRYYPQGTQNWYFPQTRTVNTHGLFLLMDDSMDRSGFIGFRCMADTQTDAETDELDEQLVSES